jgi:hypothetical protein
MEVEPVQGVAQAANPGHETGIYEQPLVSFCTTPHPDPPHRKRGEGEGAAAQAACASFAFSSANAQSSQGVSASRSDASTVAPHQMRSPAGASR